MTKNCSKQLIILKVKINEKKKMILIINKFFSSAQESKPVYYRSKELQAQSWVVRTSTCCMHKYKTYVPELEGRKTDKVRIVVEERKGEKELERMKGKRKEIMNARRR